MHATNRFLVTSRLVVGFAVLIPFIGSPRAPGQTGPTTQEKAAAHSPQSDWRLFRGNEMRSGRSPGFVPRINAVWKRRLTDSLGKQAQDWIKDGLESRAPGNSLIPASFPIAVGGNVIYPAYGHLRCVEIKTGDLQWESLAIAGLNELANGYRSSVRDFIDRYKQANELEVLFANSTIGTLSADNSYVYWIEDLGLPVPNREQVRHLRISQYCKN